jgi:DNA polymerase III subunit delta'
MSFADIFCQDRAISILSRAFSSEKTAHAYVFAGPEGVGKFKTAQEWARLLLCSQVKAKTGDKGKIYESCGSCPSCKLWQEGAHPDFFHVYKELRQYTADGKGKAAPVELPIDVIREFLIAKVSTRPTISDRKVFVVSEGEKLNTAAQNALLKVLEEPPAYCCIVLLCARLEKLLPTIKSRAQTVRFGPIDEGHVCDALIGKGLAKAQALYFARLAQGSMGTACNWADLELAGAELFSLKQQLVSSLTGIQAADAVDLGAKLLDNAKHVQEFWTKADKETSRSDLKRRALKTVVQMVLAVLDDAMRVPLQMKRPYVNVDQQSQITGFATRIDPEQAADRIADCYEAIRWIEAGVNERLIFERLLLKIAGVGIISGL